MDAREAVLARVRDALARSQTAPPEPVVRAYRTTGGTGAGEPATVELLAERVADYEARVHRCTPEDLPDVVAALLAGVASAVVPAGLPTAWTGRAAAAGTDVRPDDPPLTHAELDATAAVVTGARVAIAETGTIVLDAGPDQGRRAITLLPDHHVCVVRAHQVVATVPEAVAELGLRPERPLTWIAGPSATSDIELQRIEGVHGPRRLDVVILAG